MSLFFRSEDTMLYVLLLVSTLKIIINDYFDVFIWHSILLANVIVIYM